MVIREVYYIRQQLSDTAQRATAVTTMLSLSKQTDYALLALSSLAIHADNAHAAVSVKEIAEQYDIPIEFLAKVLSKLSRAGIVTSTYGPTGGYKLAMPARDLSVGRIVEIIDGQMALTQCMKTDHNGCHQSGKCTIRGPLERINTEMLKMLHDLSLAQVVRPDVIQVNIGSAQFHRAPAEPAGAI